MNKKEKERYVIVKKKNKKSRNPKSGLLLFY